MAGQQGRRPHLSGRAQAALRGARLRRLLRPRCFPGRNPADRGQRFRPAQGPTPRLFQGRPPDGHRGGPPDTAHRAGRQAPNPAGKGDGDGEAK